MANSKLLKEAIADAKAVKETALANAKLALEEAFTPRLQSILAQKMQAEAEETEKDDADMKNEELSSTGIGSKTDAGYPETPGAQPNYKADTDLSVGVKKDGGKPEQAGTDYKKVADINEEEGMEDQFGMGDEKDHKIAELTAKLAEFGYHPEEEEEEEEEGGMQPSKDEFGAETPTEPNYDHHAEPDEHNEDDMDLEAIIRELEAQLNEPGSEEEEEGTMYESEEEEEEEESKNESYSDGSDAGTDKSEDPKVVMNKEGQDVTKASGKAPRGSFDKDNMDEVIDLEEILREMEADMTDDKEDKKEDEKEAELNEAYKVIKSLQTTINEVNLLNAKLLFANKLFRAHNMTNEQKVKVIETLDRTNSVREVKLVYSTLAENFKYTSITKTAKKSMTEGIASKVTKSTKPAQAKQVIAENTDFSDRFKKLAGILK
jgi:hypothetical protein